MSLTDCCNGEKRRSLTITCKQTVIQPEHLPQSVRTAPRPAQSNTETQPSLLAFGLSFEQMVQKMLEEALAKVSGNVSEASRRLKMTRNTPPLPNGEAPLFSSLNR